MFSGIIERLGEVTSLARRGAGAVLGVTASGLAVGAGESVALDGVCLTALDAGEGRFRADLSAETLARTNLGDRRKGDRVNLEQSLRMGDRLGGHFVLGHVDARGRVESLTLRRHDARLVVRFPTRYHSLVVEKGSVAVNGVSLTIAAAGRSRFEVALVPYTLAATNLKGLRPADRVNLEFDYLAKLVQGQLAARDAAAARRIEPAGGRKR